jgi:hypothetical protein
MVRRSPALRQAALLSAGALVLHELRYRLGYGVHAPEVLATQGHAYLSYASALALALLVAAACGLGALLLRAPARPAPLECRAVPFGHRWISSTAALLAIYASQELLEGLLSRHHPDGLAAVFGHGGWVAVALALGIGALLAAAAGGTDAALALAGRRRAPRPPWPRRATSLPRSVAGFATPRCSVLSLNLAGRAPPAAR